MGTLISATTPEAVEAALCTHLSAADRYRLAWVGTTRQGLDVRQWSGSCGAYLDDCRSADSSALPATTAEREERAVVVDDTLTAEGPCRDAALNHGLRSSISVPLTHGIRHYGVLEVHASRPDVFRDDERAVLSELAELTATVLTGLDRERARSEGFTVHRGDGSETDVLREAGAEEAKIVVAATADDDVNLLVCQIARAKFGIERLYSRVNDPDNTDAFDSLDVTAVDSPMATATAIDDEIERPALTHWMNNLGDGHDVQEVEITADDLVGKTIRELNAEIPDGCIVAVIGREGETHVPDADETLERGDHLTFIGDEDAVRRAMNRFHPHD